MINKSLCSIESNFDNISLLLFSSLTFYSIFKKLVNISLFSFNPLTSPGEGVTVFTSPYLSAGTPAQGESKGLIFTFF